MNPNSRKDDFIMPGVVEAVRQAKTMTLLIGSAEAMDMISRWGDPEKIGFPFFQWLGGFFLPKRGQVIIENNKITKGQKLLEKIYRGKHLVNIEVVVYQNIEKDGCNKPAASGNEAEELKENGKSSPVAAILPDGEYTLSGPLAKEQESPAPLVAPPAKEQKTPAPADEIDALWGPQEMEADHAEVDHAEVDPFQNEDYLVDNIWGETLLASHRIKLLRLASYVEFGSRKRGLMPNYRLHLLKKHVEAIRVVSPLLFLNDGGCHLINVLGPIVRAWYSQDRERVRLFVDLLATGAHQGSNKRRIKELGVSKSIVKDVLSLKERLRYQENKAGHINQTYNVVQQTLLSFLNNRPIVLNEGYSSEIFRIPGDEGYPKVNWVWWPTSLAVKKTNSVKKGKDQDNAEFDELTLHEATLECDQDSYGHGRINSGLASMDEIAMFALFWWETYGSCNVAADRLLHLAKENNLFRYDFTCRSLAIGVLGPMHGKIRGTNEFYWLCCTKDEPQNTTGRRTIYKIYKRS